ncbi:MAG: hypothetical protein CMP47_04885 [Rickettsiales bacterium]|jgi:hypothetical protein|nr:hypothetical protein [Rickettsiales bacterium]
MKNYTEDEVYELALKRLADIFSISELTLKPEMRFGKDLKSIKASGFKYNEFDRVLFDIEDLSSRKMYKKLEKGEVKINTVDDYCNFIISCYFCCSSSVEASFREWFE